jgi:flagellar basal-body rod modification protein FlgD
MSINAINSSGSISNFNQISRIPSQVLDQDDFLKLVMAQMTAQDPLNPKKDTDFIAQMAQFSALEQSRSMQSDMSKLRSEQQVLQANSLLSRQVTLMDSDQQVIRGVVSAVHMLDGAPRLVVGGRDYDLSQVLTIMPQPTETAPIAHPAANQVQYAVNSNTLL